MPLTPLCSLARLVGLLLALSVSLGALINPDTLPVLEMDAPKFNLETPVLSSPSLVELVVLALVRFRPEDRIVALEGMDEWLLWALPPRGLAFGGVWVGAGSLLRTLWTRASSFCILPISPRIW